MLSVARFLHLACFGAALLPAGMLSAQTAQAPAAQPAITEASNPSSADLQAWIESKNPRRIAWAAYFAGERGDNVVLDALVQALPSLPGLGYSSVGYGPDHDAALVVLDTLLRQHEHVPVQAISEASQHFPEQALLLASQLPSSESAGLYASWYNLRNGDYAGRLLARVSTLLLGDAPPPSIVTSVLNEAEEHLVVTVQAPDTRSGGVAGLGIGCGDGGAGGSPPGWPAISTYSFEENNHSSTAPVLVSWPGERITYIRRGAYGGFGSCYGVRWLDARTRHALIAHWLGLENQDLPWPLQADVSIVWTTRDRYLLELGQHVDSARQVLQSTVHELVARKLLSPEAAGSVQPRLIVTVLCAIKPCPLGDAQTYQALPDPYSN